LRLRRYDGSPRARPRFRQGGNHCQHHPQPVRRPGEPLGRAQEGRNKVGLHPPT